MSGNRKWKHWRKEYWKARDAYQDMVRRHDMLTLTHGKLLRERGGYFWRLLCAIFGR